MTRFGLLVLTLLVIQAVPARGDVPPGPSPRPPLYPPPVIPPPGPAPVPNPPAPPADLGPIAPPTPEGFKPAPVLALPSPPAPSTPQQPEPPAPPRTQIDPATGLPARVPRTAPPPPPPRTGPFRSCGSGAGTGLAGIGAAWAVLWFGNRFASRTARRTKNVIG